MPSSAKRKPPCEVQESSTDENIANTSTPSDGTVSLPILSSLLQPIGAKGVIYNVPLEITVRRYRSVCSPLLRS